MKECKLPTIDVLSEQEQRNKIMAKELEEV